MRASAVLTERLLYGLLIGLVLAVSVPAICSAVRDRTTVSSLSPDDSVRARLVETFPRFIDRNFKVRLEFLDREATLTIFTSPDEGMPEGSERFIWSKDGTMLLLVGRHFIHAPGPLLETGEDAYFLYHVPSRRGWCASKQQRVWPPLTDKTLSQIEFTQEVPLRNR